MTRDAELRKFLGHALPPQNRNNVDGIVRALDEAGRRYVRYAETRRRWENYQTRRTLLGKILKEAEKLHADLAALDPITKDELGMVYGGQEVELLLGQLSRLTANKTNLLDSIQSAGRPRDLAIWTWVLAIKDIYETNFDGKATISGSGDSDPSTRGPFFKLLELSKPDSFPRYGSLHPKQLRSILRTRQCALH